MKFSDILRNIIPGKNNKPAAAATNPGQQIAAAIAETGLNLQQTINKAVQDRLSSPEFIEQLVPAIKQVAGDRATMQDAQNAVDKALCNVATKKDMEGWKDALVQHIGTFMNQSKTIAKKNFNLN